MAEKLVRVNLSKHSAKVHLHKFFDLMSSLTSQIIRPFEFGLFKILPYDFKKFGRKQKAKFVIRPNNFMVDFNHKH